MIQSVEVLYAEILKGALSRQQVIAGNEQSVADGHDRSFADMPGASWPHSRHVHAKRVISNRCGFGRSLPQHKATATAPGGVVESLQGSRPQPCVAFHAKPRKF